MCSALVLVLMLLVASRSEAAPALAWTHTRALTPAAADLLSYAAARAPAVRALLDTLDASDVVVYVTDAMSGSVGEPQAYLRFVARASGLRYLLVQIERWDVSPSDRVAWLAHELQHAVEIAAAPEVIDDAGIAQLYGRIGWRSARGRFESDGARRMGRLVKFQLGGRFR